MIACILYPNTLTQMHSLGSDHVIIDKPFFVTNDSIDVLHAFLHPIIVGRGQFYRASLFLTIVFRRVWLRGQGGLHQDFLEIDFLVVSDRGE